MWDPSDSEESVRKTKDLKSDVKALDESAERSEFSSQALFLIRFQILYFSQIPEQNKDPTSHISVPF